MTLAIAVTIGLPRLAVTAPCPPVDDAKMASCKSAVLDGSLPQFVDAGSPFKDCIPIAEAWRSCHVRSVGLDQAYVLLGAAFAIDHDQQNPDVTHALPYLVAGDEMARRLLDAAARSGEDARAPYPQLLFLLEHANHGY